MNLKETDALVIPAPPIRPPPLSLAPQVPPPPSVRRRCSARFLVRASQSAEQLTMAAERLSSVRCRELLAACCVELLKASLVGSAPQASSGGGSTESPEALLDALHASLQSGLQDAAHSIAPEHHEAWAESQWEGFQEAQVGGGACLVVCRLLHCRSAVFAH